MINFGEESMLVSSIDVAAGFWRWLLFLAYSCTLVQKWQHQQSLWLVRDLLFSGKTLSAWFPCPWLLVFINTFVHSAGNPKDSYSCWTSWSLIHAKEKLKVWTFLREQLGRKLCPLEFAFHQLAFSYLLFKLCSPSFAEALLIFCSHDVCNTLNNIIDIYKMIITVTSLCPKKDLECTFVPLPCHLNMWDQES